MKVKIWFEDVDKPAIFKAVRKCIVLTHGFKYKYEVCEEKIIEKRGS